VQDDIAIWYRGANYQLGRGRHGYAIWPVTGQPEYPLEQWPETPQGWAAAWSRFNAIEHPAAIVHLSEPAVPEASPGSSVGAAGLLAAGVVCGIVGLFPAYLAGASLAKVCKWLNEAGSRPRTWKEDKPVTWSPSSLDKVLRNQSLIGRRCDEDGRVFMKHDPILDLETWNRLQAEMDRRASRTGVASAATALLTGVAVCGHCGSPMYRVSSSARRKDGSRNTNVYYRCHGTSRDRSECRNMVPLAELDAWVNGQMAVSAGHVTETTVTPGSGHADAIAQVDADIAALDSDDPDWLGKVQAFRAERARLKALPSEPARVTEEVAPYTVGELWGLLDPAQRRAYLLSAGVQVRAVRGDYRLDGDPARLARGWSATAPVNREMVWQKLHEMADHQAAARWPDDELGTEGEPR